MSTEMDVVDQMARRLSFHAGNLATLQNIRDLMAEKGQHDADSYSLGFYNGLEMARGILAGEETPKLDLRSIIV